MYMVIKLSLSTYTMIEDDLYRAHILHHFYKIQHMFVMDRSLDNGRNVPN